MSQHTAIPWSQGITLITGQTRKWTPEQVEENDRRERRMIFSGFTAADKGRSRKYIAVCDREEDAKHIVHCVNQYDPMLAALKGLYKMVEENFYVDDSMMAAYSVAYEIIAKCEASQ